MGSKERLLETTTMVWEAPVPEKSSRNFPDSTGSIPNVKPSPTTSVDDQVNCLLNKPLSDLELCKPSLKSQCVVSMSSNYSQLELVESENFTAWEPVEHRDNASLDSGCRLSSGSSSVRDRENSFSLRTSISIGHHTDKVIDMSNRIMKWAT